MVNLRQSFCSVRVVVLIAVISLFYVDIVDALSLRTICPLPKLKNGVTRVRNRGRLARFQCSAGFELIGQRFTACKATGWDAPAPICARPGCLLPSHLPHGVRMPSPTGTTTVFFCDPDYTLIGNGMIYCDGYNWNGTLPTCKKTNASMPPLSCDFESDFCGWRQENQADFMWEWKKNGNSDLDTFNNTGNFVELFDNTLDSYPSALLISPVYPSNLTENGCFSFKYFMRDPASSGNLKFYVLTESLTNDMNTLRSSFMNDMNTLRPYLILDIAAQFNEVWRTSLFDFEPLDEDFQIVIEASKNSSIEIQLALDDFSIEHQDECKKKKSLLSTSVPVSVFSCKNRCANDPFKFKFLDIGCSCEAMCSQWPSRCCSDYKEHCIFEMPEISTAVSDDSSFYSTPEYATETSSLLAISKQTTDDGPEKNQTSDVKKVSLYTKYVTEYTDKLTIADTTTSKITTTITPVKNSTSTTAPTTNSTSTKSTNTILTNTTIQTTKPSSKIMPTTTKPAITNMTTKKVNNAVPTTKSTKPTSIGLNPTLQFKTPPQPYKNVTGILNKTISTTKENVNKTTPFATTVSRNGNKINNPTLATKKNTTKITSSSVEPKQTTSTISKTTTQNPYTKTLENIKILETSLVMSVETTTLFLKTKDSANVLGYHTFKSLKDSKVEEITEKGLSVLSKICVIFLCVLIVIMIVSLAFFKTDRLRRTFVQPFRNRFNRLSDRRRSGSNADIRFLVEDEELEHDL